MALKSNHLRDPAVNVSLKQKIETDPVHYFFGIYGRRFIRGFIIVTHTETHMNFKLQAKYCVKAKSKTRWLFCVQRDHEICFVVFSVQFLTFVQI